MIKEIQKGEKFTDLKKIILSSKTSDVDFNKPLIIEDDDLKEKEYYIKVFRDTSENEGAKVLSEIKKIMGSKKRKRKNRNFLLARKVIKMQKDKRKSERKLLRIGQKLIRKGLMVVPKEQTPSAYLSKVKAKNIRRLRR